ncbi:S8 family peptidase [Halorarius litoreus]|uniref:S8 family peptidase n=1 Tax=Halorarius litoreus TaxID=2962676 RepID=UPI0020CE9D90|nr:S8 family peptidase [Halorarius litoreus]
MLRGVAGTAVGLGLVGSAGANARAQRYIVAVEGDRGVRAARSRAVSVRHEIPLGGGRRAVAGLFSPTAVAALERRRDVRYVEEDGPVYAIHHGKGGHAPNNDDSTGGGGGSNQTLPWGVDRVDAEAAHAGGFMGKGAHVAIIDTGIDSDHPDLRKNLGDGVSFVGCRGGPKDCKTSWDDDDGHGTHCAGTVAAISNDRGVVGIAPEATLHAVKVLDNNGSGRYSDVAAGIEWVASRGYDVASMSLGGGYSETLGIVCANAAAAGVLLVAAAGNDYGGSVSYPAAYDSVLAVSATTSTDGIASFSNVGPQVDLAAPGVGIESTWYGGGYSTISGTSMACPHVSGAAALLMADDGVSNAAAWETLTRTAEDIGRSADEQGAGLLDAATAVGVSSADDLTA